METNVGFDNLTNITQPSIFYAASCTTTPFDAYKPDYYNHEYTLGAAYTVAGLYGGVAYIGNTRSGYIGTDPFYVQEFLRHFDNGLKIGDVLSSSKYTQVSKNTAWGNYVCGFRLSLIGDPEMNIWSKAPKRLNIGATSGTDGSALFSGADIAGAMVTVSNGQNITFRSRSYFNTSVSIPNVTNCNVTITKPGCLPQSFLFIDGSTITNERTYFMSSGSINGVEIGYGGKVTIYASGDVVLDNLCNVRSHGYLEIITDGSISVKSGTLDTGGMMYLKARGTITISPLFRIKAGGILRQTYIQ